MKSIYITSQQSLDSLAPSPDADQEELVFNVKGIQAAAAFNLVHLEVCLLITRNISDWCLKVEFTQACR